MSLLELINLKQAYDGRVVLDVPHLAVDKGSCVALVGSNGSGKTTLLEIAALLKRPNEGQVFINGKIVNWSRLDPFRPLISFAAQEPYFFRGSLINNIRFGLKYGKLSNNELNDRISKYLELLGIVDISGRSPRTFSGGEMKRAAIARALCRETQILILDEPFTSIDNQSASVLDEVIGNLAGDRTVMFSTHELHRAESLADSVITLEGGKISPWTPDNLFRMTAYTAGDGMELVHNGAANGASSEAENHAIYYPGDLVEGRQYLISLNASEVIVSRDEIRTSARNSFQGLVRQIKTLDNRTVHLTVECSKNFQICAILTERALKDLEINVGDKVWVHFKSTAVYLHE